MKHLKLFESFDQNSIQDVKDLFVDLEDQHFVVDVSQDKCVDLITGDQTEFRACGARLHQMMKFEPHAKDIIIVTIQKMIPKDQFKGRSLQTRYIDTERVPEEFHMDEIMETLLFAESYSKDKMELNIKWIFDGHVYYKSVKYIPIKKLDEIIIGFA